MEWVWSSLSGFGLGLASSLIVLRIQRRADERSERDYARKIVRSLVFEIEEGIARAEGLLEMAQKNQASFSRIYTDLWRSTNQQLASKLADPKVLVLLHRVYYRFDLVNFNFEHDRPGPAAAFAKEYLAEMKDNLTNLKAMVDEW